MKSWEELSIPKKALFVGFVFISLSVDKIDKIIIEAKKTYNIMCKEEIRKERMN